MYCKHCGKEITDDASFCQYCGGVVTANTTATTQRVAVEQQSEPLEDTFRKILKIVFKKLLQLIGIVAISIVAGFLMYHIFMLINRPCRDKEEALELDEKYPARTTFGSYKYDSEVSSPSDLKNLWSARLIFCKSHALNWGIGTFIIVGVALLGFFFFKWLYKPKKEQSNDTLPQKKRRVVI